MIYIPEGLLGECTVETDSRVMQPTCNCIICDHERERERDFYTVILGKSIEHLTRFEDRNSVCNVLVLKFARCHGHFHNYLL